MIRTHILLDSETHLRLRRLAFERHTSVAAVVRGILAEALGTSSTGSARYDFGFVGIVPDDARPVAEGHDAFLSGEDRW